MRIVLVSIIVAILVSAPLAQAQTHVLQESRLQTAPAQKSKPGIDRHLELKAGEKDYLLQGEGFVTGPPVTVKASTSKYTAANAGPVESVVQYKSFSFGTTFTLNAFNGKYVSYLIPQNLIGAGGLSREEIRELVDLTDVLYAQMVEVVGGEPAGDGLLTIALLNPGYEFGGKGWVGKKGVEMYEGYALTYKKDFLAGCAPNVVIHEMSHNFDIYNAYISHNGNNYHAWTAFLIPYMQYYTQSGASRRGQVVNPALVLSQSVDVHTEGWDSAATTANWADCVKSGNGCPDKGIYANEAWAGMVLRFAQLHGAPAIKQAFRFVGDYKAAHPTPPATAESKNDLLITGLAAGAGVEVSCELKVWNWPVSSETAKQMQVNFPNQNGFCNDVDNDNHSPADGDLDDFNAAIHPGITETINGLDDDCNGLIDDVVLNEVEDVPADVHLASRMTIPGHVKGHTSTASDIDSYQIEIDTPRSINIWAKGSDKYFSGWFELRYAGDTAETPATYLASESPGGTVIPFDRAGTWIITVMPWTGADEAYEIFLSEIEPILPPELQLVATTPAGVVIVSVTPGGNSGMRSINSQPTKVRLWAEGMGFISEQRFEPATIFKVKLPTNKNVRLRAQLLAGDSPLSSATKSMATVSQERSGTQTVISNSPNSPARIPTAVDPGPQTNPIHRQKQFQAVTLTPSLSSATLLPAAFSNATRLRNASMAPILAIQISGLEEDAWRNFKNSVRSSKTVGKRKTIARRSSRKLPRKR